LRLSTCTGFLAPAAGQQSHLEVIVPELCAEIWKVMPTYFADYMRTIFMPIFAN